MLSLLEDLIFIVEVGASIDEKPQASLGASFASNNRGGFTILPTYPEGKEVKAK